MSDKPTYTVGEVAELMGFSRMTITRLFQDEPGVIVLRRPEQMHKRGYRSMRIPRTVLLRVQQRLAVR
jgi:hypothetical protein